MYDCCQSLGVDKTCRKVMKFNGFFLEVMKMEVPYEAPHSGTIAALHIAEGDSVSEDDLAIEIE